MSAQYQFPYKMRWLTDEEKEIIHWDKDATGMTARVKLIGSRTGAPSRIKEMGNAFYNFKPRSDDVWLVGFPRSGTTLTQEILYLIGTDLNYEKAAAEIMDVRFPVLHTALYRNEDDEETYENSALKKELITPAHEVLENTTDKRFIKSHFGFNLLHPKLLETGCKVVFISRNVKDAMASLSRYPYYANIPGFCFKNMWDIFKYDLGGNGNYFEMLEEAWKRRHHKNLLILFYEEVNADKEAAVLKIADFLGKKFTDDELDTLLKHLKIENFRNNKSLNNDHLVDIGLYAKNDKFSFIRQGKSGGWRDVIPPELVPEIDEWALKNLRAIPDFEIPKFWLDAMDLKKA